MREKHAKERVVLARKWAQEGTKTRGGRAHKFTKMPAGWTVTLTPVGPHLVGKFGSTSGPVKAVANAVRRSRAGLNDEDRPLGSFLFLGPTGVGKTELTKAVAEFMFDDDNAMVPRVV